MIFQSDAAGMDAGAGECPACRLQMGWEERFQGAGAFGPHLTQGAPNFKAHEVGKQLSQSLPRLLAGRSLLWQHGCPAAGAATQLLCGVPSGKKEQLMLSRATTKKPHSQQGVLQNSDELSTPIPAPSPAAACRWARSLSNQRAAERAGLGIKETSLVMPPARGYKITLKGWDRPSYRA